jgi:putative membrane protein
MNIQQELALERTRLANERTFLSYVRTALSLIAGGVVVLQYLAESPKHVFAGWLLVALGAVVLTIGFVRFISVRSKINA